MFELCMHHDASVGFVTNDSDNARGDNEYWLVDGCGHINFVFSFFEATTIGFDRTVLKDPHSWWA